MREWYVVYVRERLARYVNGPARGHINGEWEILRSKVSRWVRKREDECVNSAYAAPCVCACVCVDMGAAQLDK